MKETSLLLVLLLAGPLHEMTRLVASLQRQQDVEGEDASAFWVQARVPVVKQESQWPSSCERWVCATPSPCQKRSMRGVLLVIQVRVVVAAVGFAQCRGGDLTRLVGLRPRTFAATA